MKKASLQEVNDLILASRNENDSVSMALLKELGYGHNQLFKDADETLGQHLYNSLKILIQVSELSWKLSKKDWKGWIDEVFKEL